MKLPFIPYKIKKIEKQDNEPNLEIKTKKEERKIYKRHHPQEDW